MRQGGDLSQLHAGSFIRTFEHALICQYDAKHSVFYAPYVSSFIFVCFVRFVPFGYCLTLRAVVLQKSSSGKPDMTLSGWTVPISSAGVALMARQWTRVKNRKVVIVLANQLAFSRKPLGHNKFHQAWRCCCDNDLWFWQFYWGMHAFGPILSGSWDRWFCSLLTHLFRGSVYCIRPADEWSWGSTQVIISPFINSPLGGRPRLRNISSSARKTRLHGLVITVNR